MKKFEFLHLTSQEGVTVVTLSNPPVNAQNRAMRLEIIQAFDMLTDDVNTRCVILTGSGGTFCAGADIKERKTLTGEGAFWEHSRTVREVGNSINECKKPVIAAINGPAIGAGFGLVMNCDIWVASKNSYVSMPEIDVGLAGGTAAIQRVFGKSRSRRMAFTGMKVSAEELYRLGLIEACTEADDLMDYCMDMAREIAAKSPVALTYAKEASRITTLMPQKDAYRFEQDITLKLSKTEDSAEAQLAFLEKRKPVFQGR